MIMIRKERHHLFITLIINVLVLYVFADACNGLHHAMDKNIQVACMDVLENSMDFDEDEDDDLFPDFFESQPIFIPPMEFLMMVQPSSETMIDKALRIGQVRRHFPREDGINDYSYTVCHNGSSDVEQIHITFFMQFKMQKT